MTTDGGPFTRYDKRKHALTRALFVVCNNIASHLNHTTKLYITIVRMSLQLIKLRVNIMLVKRVISDIGQSRRYTPGW